MKNTLTGQEINLAVCDNCGSSAVSYNPPMPVYAATPKAVQVNVRRSMSQRPTLLWLPRSVVAVIEQGGGLYVAKTAAWKAADVLRMGYEGEVA
jgi:hypothetical protein